MSTSYLPTCSQGAVSWQPCPATQQEKQGQPGKELVHGKKRKRQGAEAKNNRRRRLVRRRLVWNRDKTVVGFAESSNSGEDIEEGDVSHSKGEDEMDDEDENLPFGLELDEEDEDEKDSDAYDEFEEFM